MHTDATYSVNWNGFPLLIVGTSDLNRKFHPLGLAITNGFNESVIECLIRAMCWFHVKNCTDKKIKTIKDEKKRAAIISDIVIMQLCQSPAIFEAATKLFLKHFVRKWSHLAIQKM